LLSEPASREAQARSETTASTSRRDRRRADRSAFIGYFEARRASLKTFNNRRGIVSTFLKFSLHAMDCENPLVRFRAPDSPSARGAQTPPQPGEELMDLSKRTRRQRFVLRALPSRGIRPCLRTGEILRLKPST